MYIYICIYITYTYCNGDMELVYVSIQSPFCRLQMIMEPDGTPAIYTGDREIVSPHQVCAVDPDSNCYLDKNICKLL